MERRMVFTPAMRRLADLQAGVISHEQLVGLGASVRAAWRWKQGWQDLGRGIYCLGAPTWESWCWAGILHAGPSGVIGGLAAAHLHELLPDPPSQITLWHDRTNRLLPLGDSEVQVTFRRAFRRGRGELARTGVEDTVLDSAGEIDENQMVALTARALSQRLTTPSRLLTGLGERYKVRHRQVLVTLCDQSAAGVESVLEWRFLNVVVRAHGLPEPTRQAVLVRGTRSDCCWPEYGVVAELDGRRWHKDQFRDMNKDNRVALTGALNLRYGWDDVTHRACETSWQLHQGLSLRGYGGSRGRCRNCRLVGMV